MNWSNVRLILQREVRDQLRDRRTLFMIAVLPLLLYPLLGMSFFQVAQFTREQTIKVWVIDSPTFAGLPPLVEGNQFSSKLYHDAEKAHLVQVDSTTTPNNKAKDGADGDPLAEARQAVRQGTYEAVVYFPPDFSRRLQDFRAHLGNQNGLGSKQPELPAPVIYYNTAKEKSQIAYGRLSDVLGRWREEIGRQNLEESKVSPAAAKPFDLKTDDVAEVSHRKAALWSKILPFVLLLWALTGAFYPAVDLCAGEKERGTLETLLSSPAERSEIVWGKLLTIMLFSMATAILNLLSMGITGTFVLTQLPHFGPPPALAVVWLLAALVPVSALFSALCLALAAFARSTKEGQYYLMPLVLVTMPLTILPMAPGVELNLGNSLIPITGIVLLLRSLLEGNYLEALPYVPVVVAVTLVCCLLAMRWAADQFNTESVLFRESERFDVGLWFKQLLRDREDTPTVSEAVFCGVLILLIQFFMNFALSKEHQQNLAVLAAVSQLAIVATPALLMTVMLTRSPRKTLLFKVPPLAALPAALLLALAVHPLANVLRAVVMRVYPISEPLAKQLNALFIDMDVWQLLLLVAVVPAICEELAFRGFVLSGLRHMGHKWRAIVISSIFFGVTHGILQQSMIACLLGVLLGFLAVQSGSILPGMLFHLTHNSLAVLASKVDVKALESYLDQYPALNWLVEIEGKGFEFRWPVLVLCAGVTVLLLAWFRNLAYARSPEESLQEAIEHQAAHSLA